MGFSPEQLEAINIHGSNVIVSAGAGSGKTAVLTERIKEILKSGINAKQLLVLTFTEAAAAEMKERVIKKMLEDPDLSSRTSEVDGAYITTFDSFALSIVKRYHDRINLSNDLSIIDKSVMNVFKRKKLESIMNEYYEAHDERLEDLVFELTDKSDTLVKENIIKIVYKKIETKADVNKYLDEYLSNNFNDEVIDSYIGEFTDILKERIDEIKNYYSKVMDDELLSQDNKNEITSKLQLLFVADNYDKIKNAVQDAKKTVRKIGEDAKNAKKMMDSIIDDIKKQCIYESVQEIKDVYYGSEKYVSFIIDVVKRLYKEVNEYKNKHEVYEFHDIAKMSIDLLENNEDIKEQLKDEFYEILIDEYQDTNDVQEYFISKIANNNVYMVGDIKQSIYGFRNANPMIFKSKYDKYRYGEGGKKIDLNKNFRSNKPVINIINKIFNRIMDDKVGNADYINEHQMTFGQEIYNKESQENKIKLAVYPKESDADKIAIEQFYIVQDIKKKIANQEIIYDKDKKDFRPCTFKDFAILMPSSKVFDDTSKILSYYNIPNVVYKDKDLSAGNIIKLFKNILKLVTLDYKGVYDSEFLKNYYGVGRSFIFIASDEELFLNVTEQSFKNTKLYKFINKYSSMIDTKSLKMIVSEMIEELDVYEKIITIGDVNQNILSIEYLEKMVDDMQKIELSIFDFVDYFDDIFDNEEKLESKVSENQDNKVKLITIHKSKGLEYPIVYFMNGGVNFKKQDSEVKATLLYDNKYGIITPFYKDAVGKNINRILYENRKYKDMVSEKIRLLYVAYTRAREQMIILCQDEPQQFERGELIPLYKRESFSSVNDIVCSVYDELLGCVEKIDVEGLKISDKYKFESRRVYDKYLKKNDSIINHIQNVDNSSIVTSKRASKEGNKLISQQEKEVMEYGTHMHEVFQSFNFIKENYGDYKPNEVKIIKRFLASDIVKDIKKAKVYKEFEFIYKDGDNSIHGIIDLMCEYEGHIDIIDYKLSHVEDEAYVNQLNTYRRYIQKKKNKPVYLYLYSMMSGNYTEVKQI